MGSYVTDYMRRELAGHALEPLLETDGVKLYRMARPGTGIYAVHVAEFAGRLCLAGDICLGGNDRGVVSAPGYGIAWFAGQLSESYLCEKFLREEWQWDVAAESIRWLIEQDTEEGEGWWLERAAELQAFLGDPGWRYDEPDQTEYYERMTALGHDGCELPGFGYPRGQAGWLCAIQRRFSELHAELGGSLAESLALIDRGMEDARAGRVRPAKEAIEGIADGLGLKADRGREMTDNSDRATPRPGERESIDCGVCGDAMEVRRNAHGPTGMAEAMAGRGHPHDSFRCPNIDEDWHVQAKRIREAAERTPSRRAEEALLEEAAEIIAARRATKKVGRLGS